MLVIPLSEDLCACFLRLCRRSSGTWPFRCASNRVLQPHQQHSRSAHRHDAAAVGGAVSWPHVCLCVTQILEETYKLEFLYGGLKSRHIATIHHVRLQAKALQLILTARSRPGSVRTQTHTLTNTHAHTLLTFLYSLSLQTGNS